MRPEDGKILRIVSLLPSITEILSAIGAAEQIVGITHECDYPPEVASRAVVVTTSEINPHTMSQEEIHEAVCGSLKNGHSLYGISKEALRSVNADIIFTQQLCDVCAVSYPVVLESCAQIVAGPPVPVSLGDTELTCGLDDLSLYPRVVSLEPTNLEDVLKTILIAGKELGLEREDCARLKVQELRAGFETIRECVKGRERPTVAFIEWHDPIFSGGHWIADMVSIAGAIYTMGHSGQRSIKLNDEEFIDLDPDIILIGPCGFSLERSLADTIALNNKRSWWKEMRAVISDNVFVLDGNQFYARPGPRLLQGCGIMAACIHGEEVRNKLGESLAPSYGFARVTADMYLPRI